MIASLALASVLASTNDGPGYRLAISGAPNAAVSVTTTVPRGWVASFCSGRICAVGHIPIRLPASGSTTIDVRFHNVNGGHRGNAEVRAAGRELTLPV
jgi:hypothetical protein